jgi:hypothetical protein
MIAMCTHFPAQLFSVWREEQNILLYDFFLTSMEFEISNLSLAADQQQQALCTIRVF